MSDIVTHTIQFNRKNQPAPYESAEAGMFIQFNTAADADVTEVIEAATERFAAAMAVVFDRLGISYEINEDGNVVEVVDVQAISTEAKVTRAVTEGPAPVAEGETVPSEPPHDRFTKDKDEKRANTNWARARHASHPKEFWDNTSKDDWNGPDYTHKDSRVGYWAD